MSLHQEDSRSGKIIFLSNCLLCASNKVREFARYPGMFTQVVETLDRFGIGVIQMPCPEVLYMGNQRWWNSRNLYDNVGFRRFCRSLTVQMVDYIQNYEIMGYQVVGVLVCNGSPTCGLTLSSYCEDWGGRPKEIPRTLVEKPGIYTEELLKEIQERGIKMPPFYGLTMDDRTKSEAALLEEFESFIKEQLSKS